MANKGLKKYTKQITQTIGNVAKVSVNVNKTDANMHIIIPLIQTLGPNPLDLSLIFNYQDINKDRAFGKGCTINTFKDIRYSSSVIEVFEADGSSISYSLDKNENYYSKESPLKVSKGSIYLSGDGDYDTFTITDQQGNYEYFDENYSWYPNSIRYVNGFRTTFDGANMDNGQGAKITFTETSNYMYSRATYTQDGTTKYYVDFSYDSSKRITAVKHYKESKLVKHLSISYGTNEITVKDEILKDYAKYTFVNNCVTKIIEVLNGNTSNAVETSISYEDSRTILTDNDGRKVYIYFDKNSFPLFEIDEDGNAIETEYDANTKRLIAKSSNIPTKNQLATIATPNISMFTKTSGITTRLATVNDSVLSSILNPVFYVSGTGSLTYTIFTKGLGSDTITAVIWGKQWSTYSNSSNVKVTLTVDENNSDEFKKTRTDGNFDMMTLGVSAIRSYSKITLTITLTGNASIEIGGIQVLKKDFGAFYQYDEKGNLIGSESGKGTVSNDYNSKGLQTRSVGKDSAMYDYEYDDKGNMTLAKTAFGGKIENTYDEYNNVTRSVVSNAVGTKKLETIKAYEKGRYVSSEKDELGNETSYNYDSFGKIKKVIDALKATTEYSYDAFDNLTEILFNSSVSVNYTYNSQNLLKTVTLPNETVYSFGYDSCNNLNSVSMNGVLIVTFTYDQKIGLITKQKYGSSGDSFDFVYNAKHNIELIKCNGNNQYYFQYDEYDRLIKVLNYCGNVLSSYTYDNDGQITKATNNGCEIEYQYDSLGEVNQRKRTLASKTIYESYDSISRSKGFSPDNLIDYVQGNKDFLGTIFNGNADLKNSSYICKPYNYKTDDETALLFTRLGVIPCITCGLKDPISYNPPSTQYIENSGCIGFWFYPDSKPSAKRYLFYVKASSSYIKSYVAVYHNTSNQLVLELKDYNENITSITTSSKVQINQWNFFGLNFMYRDDGPAYGSVFNYELYLNAEMKKGGYSKRTIMTDGGLYHIGYRFDGSNGYDGLECKIAALMIGKRCQITSKQMQEYYSYTKDYIIGSSYIDGNSVDFSATSVHNLSETMLNQFEIYPLHNSVKSLKGKLPIAYNIRRISNTDKDRSFNYNNKIKRYAYVADEGCLIYDLDITTEGTILMRAFMREDADKQYIFECKDTGNQRIGLYRGSDKYLYIEVNGETTRTNLYFSTEAWYTVGLSFKCGTISESLGNGPCVSARVYLDGSVYSVDKHITNSFGSFRLSIGKLFESVKVTDADMGDYYTYHSMRGQIEMLATRAAFCEVATLNTLANELKDTTKVSEYDELGMLQKVVIRKSDTEILSTAMSYKKRSTYSSYISKQIEKETIKYGSSTVDRIYNKINALGKIEEITDSTFGSHRYEYNARGFLIKEDSTEYEYDDNGNITKAGNTIFAYDSKMKDRLEEVSGTVIEYDDEANPLNPTSWEDYDYTWEGRRLTSVLRRDGIKFTYTYNEQGLRIRKQASNGSTTNYYYDGDKLITEVAPSYRLDFLYDENNQLYGFISNNNSKYYYVRDFMQNILGIIASNGNLVVKYDYTAYGKITSTTGSQASTIGAYNPFRYKGYYYDPETNMYYCKSRYYVPEWCRWLNGDSIGCVNLQDINGMNLFSYCENNPIMLFDESGNMPSWAKWLVGGLVIAGAALATVLTGGAAVAVGALAGSIVSGALGVASGITLDENGWSFDADKAATGFMCGTITGAISGAVSGGISDGFTFAGHAFEKGSYVIRGIKAGVDGLLAMGSYMAQSAINGSEISVVGSLISLGTGLLDFADPMGKIFDTIWIPTIGAEIAWGYDMINNAIKKRNQKFSMAY